LGSTDALLSQGGAVNDSWVYRAFGNTQYEVANSADRYRFVGRKSYYWDSDAQLYLLGVGGSSARPLRPDLGCLVGPDLGGYASDPNRYRYCANNPTNAIDPNGL